jgi:hypothetical protein
MQPAASRSGGHRRWSLQEVDEWVAPQVPASVILGLVKGERDHFVIFNAKYGRFVSQTEVHFSLLVNAVEQIDYVEKNAWPAHRGTQFILVAKTLRTFWSAADRLHRGAYQDSITLLRLAYEVWARVIFMSCHTEDHWSGLAPSVPAGVPVFNMTNFLRDQLRLDWEKKYELMSLFAHGKIDTLLEVLNNSRNPSAPTQYELSVSFDSSRCDFAITLFNFVLLLFVTFVQERFLVGAPEPLRSSLCCSEEILRTSLFADPKPYWVNTEADLDFLSELVAVADSGGDWKTIAMGRPKVVRTSV